MTPTLEGSLVKTDIFLAPESKVITELSYAEPSDFCKTYVVGHAENEGN